MPLTAFAIVVLLAGQASSPPTADALSARIAVLENDQKLLEIELAELREQMARVAAADDGRMSRSEGPDSSLSGPVSIAGAPSKGSVDAPLILIEFSDFECPYCAAHYRRTWPEIDRQFVQTGLVRYVVRDLPLERIHPHARAAASAGACANEQGRFWEFRQRILANQAILGSSDILGYVDPAAVDGQRFAECLSANAGKLDEQIREARSYGFRTTPTFVLGRLTGDGSVKPIQTIVGARPFDVFEAAIRTASAAVTDAQGGRKE